MSIRCGLVTRGKGKIFVHVSYDENQSAVIVATSQLPDGDIYSCEVLRHPGGRGWIVVACAFSCAQTIEISALDATGHVIESRRRTLGHASSAVASKMNTALGHPELSSVRNADQRPTTDHSWIAINRMIRLNNGRRLLRGTLLTRIDSSIDVRNHCFTLDMTVRNRAGERIDAAPSSTLFQSQPLATKKSQLLRIEFSIAYQDVQAPFAITARFPNREAKPGLCCLEPWDRAKLEEDYRGEFMADGNAPGYERWFESMHRATNLDLAIQRRSSFSRHRQELKPTFSIVIPIFETPLPYLCEMLDSLLAQTFGSFELLCVNASPDNRSIGKALAEAAEKDERVRIVELDSNGGIAANTLAGINRARGDFIGFMDHDDVLEPDCLFHYAQAIVADPTIDVLYCDEDKLEDGHFTKGFLKPDFDRILLLGHNYITHFLCVRRKLVDEVGFPEPVFDGAQDYELCARAVERARTVHHVPRVLYHWRMHSKSTAANELAKPEIVEAGKKVVEGKLKRLGVRGRVRCHEGYPGLYLSDFEKVYDAETLAVVIGHGNANPSPCLEDLARTAPEADIAYLDESGEGKEVAIRGGARLVTIVEGESLPQTVNRVVRESTASLIVLVDSRIHSIPSNWIQRLGGFLQIPDVAIVAPELVYRDHTIYSAGLCVAGSLPRLLSHLRPADEPGVSWWGILPHQVSAVPGAFLVISRDAFASLGGLDERYEHCYADVDLCLKARERDKAVVIDPQCKVEICKPDILNQLEPRGTLGIVDAPSDESECLAITRDEGTFMDRWVRYFVDGDPFYNANNIRGRSNYELFGPDSTNIGLPRDQMGVMRDV